MAVLLFAFPTQNPSSPCQCHTLLLRRCSFLYLFSLRLCLSLLCLCDSEPPFANALRFLAMPTLYDSYQRLRYASPSQCITLLDLSFAPPLLANPLPRHTKLFHRPESLCFSSHFPCIALLRLSCQSQCFTEPHFSIALQTEPNTSLPLRYASSHYRASPFLGFATPCPCLTYLFLSFPQHSLHCFSFAIQNLAYPMRYASALHFSRCVTNPHQALPEQNHANHCHCFS